MHSLQVNSKGARPGLDGSASAQWAKSIGASREMALAQSFIAIDPNSHFPLQNLPYGVFSSRSNSAKRIGVALGDQVEPSPL